MSVKGESKSLRLGYLVVLVLGMYIIFVLSKSLWEIREAYRRIDSTQARLRQEERRKIDLESQLMEATSSGYVEKVARNELNMQKPGEVLVVLPENPGDQKSENVPQKEDGGVPNWKKWWNLVK